MGIFSAIFGGGASAIVDSAGSALDKLFTSDAEREEAKRLMALAEQRPQEAQWETNKIEAAHRSVWVAGWRPAIGWVLAASLASYYIPQYVMGSVLWVMECWHHGRVLAYPLEIKSVGELVLAMLGMGALRTVEKFGKVTR